MKNSLAIIVLTSCSATATLAASPPTVPEGLLACAKLQDVSERVRCYDAQVAAMSRRARGSRATATPAAPSVPEKTTSSTVPAHAETAAPAASAAPHSAPAQARVAPGDSFAAHFGEETLPPSSRPQPSPKEEELDSRITHMRKVGFDTYLITLANGQVWRQEGNRITFFRVGYAVRIEHHPLGSYHMSSPALGTKNWVYVTRMR